MVPPAQPFGMQGAGQTGGAQVQVAVAQGLGAAHKGHAFGHGLGHDFEKIGEVEAACHGAILGAGGAPIIVQTGDATHPASGKIPCTTAIS